MKDSITLIVQQAMPEEAWDYCTSRAFDAIAGDRKGDEVAVISYVAVVIAELIDSMMKNDVSFDYVHPFLEKGQGDCEMMRELARYCLPAVNWYAIAHECVTRAKQWLFDIDKNHRHLVSSGQLIAVLDEDSASGQVIGYAANEKQADAVYDNWFKSSGSKVRVTAWRRRTEPVTYDSDINTREEAEAVEKHGAWAPVAWIEETEE